MIIFGILIHCSLGNNYAGVEISEFPEFSPSMFFFVLLPPIVLENAYALHDKVFVDNLVPVLLHAVLGTTINFLMTGGLLEMSQRIRPENWKWEKANHDSSNTTTTQVFLFSSLLSSVGKVN